MVRIHPPQSSQYDLDDEAPRMMCGALFVVGCQDVRYQGSAPRTVRTAMRNRCLAWRSHGDRFDLCTSFSTIGGRTTTSGATCEPCDEYAPAVPDSRSPRRHRSCGGLPQHWQHWRPDRCASWQYGNSFQHSGCAANLWIITRRRPPGDVSNVCRI